MSSPNRTSSSNTTTQRTTASTTRSPNNTTPQAPTSSSNITQGGISKENSASNSASNPASHPNTSVGLPPKSVEFCDNQKKGFCFQCRDCKDKHCPCRAAGEKCDSRCHQRSQSVCPNVQCTNRHDNLLPRLDTSPPKFPKPNGT